MFVDMQSLASEVLETEDSRPGRGYLGSTKGVRQGR